MESHPRDDDLLDPQEIAEEEELAKLEEEVEQMAQTILNYRTSLPPQFNSTISPLLQSQRPLLPAHLLDGADPQTLMLPTQGLIRETRSSPMSDDQGREEADKIRLPEEKILSNAAAMGGLLSRVKEYMTRIDKLNSSSGIIHPAFTANQLVDLVDVFDCFDLVRDASLLSS